jgi:WD40 repeat protein
MKHKKISIIVFLFFAIVIKISAQSKDYQPFKQSNQILLNDYDINNTADLFKIVGLGSMNDKDIYWINQHGNLTFWDISQNKMVHNYSFNMPINQGIYNHSEDCFFINGISDEGKITILKDYKNGKSITLKELQDIDYRTVKVSKDGKTIVGIADSTISKWTLNKGKWSKTQIETSHHYFEFNFLNDKILVLGCDNGEIVLFDLQKLEVTKKIAAHKETSVSNISISDDSKMFASTEGLGVKVWTNQGNLVCSLKTKIHFIGAIEWLDNDLLAVGGVDNAIEIWNVRRRIVLQSFNILEKPREMIKPLPITGKSMVFSKELHKIKVDTQQLNGCITAFDVNRTGFVSVGLENYGVNVYKFKNERTLFKKSWNIYDIVTKGEGQVMNDIELSEDGNLMMVGSKYGNVTFYLENKKVLTGLVAHYSSYALVDINSFNDIALAKVDNRMRGYSIGVMTWFRHNIEDLKKKSNLLEEVINTLPKKLNKRIYDDIKVFKYLENPSGFSVSKSKKYIVQFDKTGLIQVVKIKGWEIMKDTVIGVPIVKAFFGAKDSLWIIGKNNSVYFCDFLIGNKAIVKNDSINFVFDKVSIL